MRAFVLLLGVVIGGLVLAGAARAEQAVLAPSDAAPWSDPAHQTPTEVYASQIASTIAGRPTQAQCHSASEWAALGFNPNSVGVVRFLYNPYYNVITYSENIVHLAEPVCQGLKLFGEAGHKPTRCDTTQNVTRTVYDTVTSRKKQWYWKKIHLKNGHTKRVHTYRWVAVKKKVLRTVVDEVPGPSLPCYGQTSQPLPDDYINYSFSLLVLAHESVHALYDYVGAPVMSQFEAESRAECYGMQLMVPTAQAFGADLDDARALGKFFWDNVYPGEQGTPYWRADCRPNSPLDLSPGDNVWPERSSPLGLPGPSVWGAYE